MRQFLVLVVVSMLASGPAIANDDQEMALLIREGTSSFRSGEYKDALKKFQRADELTGGASWDALAGAASASLQIGRNAKARQYAERMLEMEQGPERRGISLYLLGVSLGRLNKLSASEAALRESLEIRSDRPLSTRTSLVAVLCRQGRYEDALEFLDEEGLCAEELDVANEPEADEPQRFEADGRITEPVKISGAFPEYPEQDRLARVEGTVELDSLIGADGAIHCVKVLDERTPDMGCAAAIAVMNWRFEPSTLDGEPVDVYYHLMVHFDLR